jgi:large subunit ribosomal protein L25
MTTKHFTLSAEKRERAGKGVARALRRENNIPGVIYGDHKEAVTIQLPVKEVTLEHQKGHLFTELCDLQVDGKKELVLVRDVQIDPVSDRILHVDFLRVSPKTMIHVNVPVHFLNQETSIGLKAGGTLNVVKHEVELICQATNIPEFIEVDLATAEIGDALKIHNVKLPSGTKPAISDRDFTIATIATPRKLIEEEPVAAAADAAPAEGAAAPADAKAEDKK